MPRQRTKLTDTFIKSLKVDVRRDFWDEKVRGLVLRVTPTGVKTWTVVYTRASDGTRQRTTIGRYPVTELEKARSKALKTLGNIEDGEDPALRKRATRAAMTVQELGELFIERTPSATRGAGPKIRVISSAMSIPRSAR